MLVELRVRNLGVVRDATLLLEEGMTALTGETGAGKTMVVEAIRLLSGGRADQHMVRTGAQEAIIEGRFHDDSGEIVLTRSIRKDGRSRCSINGEMATVSAISEIGGALVDLHGQHSHQTLMHTAAQREALERRMESLEARLLKQYTAMDTLVAQLQTTSSYLTQQLELLKTQTSQ